MQTFTALCISPQWAAALALAGPLPICGAILASLVGRAAARHARLRQPTREE